MEEILASIRRIIADDDAAKTQPSDSNSNNGTPAPVLAAPARMAERQAPVAAARRLDDDDGVGRAAHPESKNDDGAAADILDLTESMEMSSAKVVGFRTVDADSDVVFDSSAAEAELSSVSPPKAASPAADRGAPSGKTDDDDDDDTLMSSRTSAAVDSAFNTLAHTVLLQNSRTLDDVVREMLRPMLRAWLDDNLPSMVERMVRAEIERVSRGR